MSSSHTGKTHKGKAFPSTRWTLVHRVRLAGPEAGAAIEELCRDYWFPIYTFLRRRGHARQDAEDLSQGFFQKLIEDGLFQTAQQEKGRLRSLLLAALEYFLADQFRRENALKRGGGKAIVSIEWARAEERYFAEPVDHQDPQSIYFLAWARSLVERARVKLRESYGAKAAIYTALESFLDQEAKTEGYREVAVRLDLHEATARVYVFRLRKRFAEVLMEEVAQTVETAEEAVEELAWLKAVLLAP